MRAKEVGVMFSIDSLYAARYRVVSSRTISYNTYIIIYYFSRIIMFVL